MLIRKVLILATLALCLLPFQAEAERLVTIPFELNSVTDAVELDSVAATAQVTSTLKRSGSYSLHIPADATQRLNSHQYQAGGSSATQYLSTFFYVDELPTSPTAIFGVGTSTTAASRMVLVRLNSNGTLNLFDNVGDISVATSTQTVATSSWNCLDLGITPDGSNEIVSADVRLDGASVASGSITAAPSNGRHIHFTRAGDEQMDIWYDDAVINDNAGTSTQNSWPSCNRMIGHLKPNAAGDNAQGANAGSDTGAAWSQVAEVTPDDLGTYYVLNDNNDTLDLNMESTAVAGIPASSTINVIQFGARHRAADNSQAMGYKLRFKTQANGTTASSSAAVTHNDATWRTNGDAVPRIHPLTVYTDPQDGSPLTTAKLDASQMGFICTDALPDCWVSTMWAEVEYEPAATSTMVVDAGSYTGNNTASTTITGLPAWTDLIIIKSSSTGENAFLRTKDMKGDQSVTIRGDSGFSTGAITNLLRDNSSSSVTLGTSASVNANGVLYHWTAVACNGDPTCKVGYYWGNGTASSTEDGPGFNPLYLLVKGNLGRTGVNHFQTASGTTASMTFAGANQTGIINNVTSTGWINNSADYTNTNATQYIYWALATSSQVCQQKYVGNNTDNRNLTDCNLNPVFTHIKANAASNPAIRNDAYTGDAAQGFDSEVTVNRIQSFPTGGIQVGTDATVNSNAVDYHYLIIGTAPVVEPPAATGRRRRPVIILIY